jgi:hypothetical protein
LYSLDPMDYEQARRLLINALAMASSRENSNPTVVTASATSVETSLVPPTDCLSPRKRELSEQ